MPFLGYKFANEVGKIQTCLLPMYASVSHPPFYPFSNRHFAHKSIEMNAIAYIYDITHS